MDILSMFQPMVILLIFLGTFFGLIFGSLPGLTAGTAVALIIPISYAFAKVEAIGLLLGTFIGGLTGGLISAILLRIPGTGASIATVFDGYPLAKKGRAAKALGTAIFSSFVGGIFSTIALMTIAPTLARVSIKFGPYEYFALTVFALSLVSMLLKGNPLRGIISCLLGLTLCFVGSSPLDGKNRFTFGYYQLNGGFQFLSVIIGLFAFSEIFHIVGNIMTNKQKDEDMKISKKDGYLPTLKEIWDNKMNFLRSALIGTGIGIMPGMGGSVGGVLAYMQAKKASKHPEEFGNGSIEGIIAVETANNAVTGGALIPMLTLGIPGESVTALVMSGFMLHGLTMGPIMFYKTPEVIRAIITGVFIANIAMFVILLFGSKIFVKVLKIPGHILYPFILVLCVIGLYGVSTRFFDVYVAIAFGLLGYILEKNEYPLAPFVLAFILGNMIEYNFRNTVIYYGTFVQAMNHFSIGNVILAITVLLILWTIFSRNFRGKRKKRTESVDFDEKD